MTKLENTIINAIKAGGNIVRADFGKKQKTYRKSIEADFYTRTDVEAENRIIDQVQKSFPDINLMAEESGDVDNGHEYTLVLDPLDGTNNYSLGMPYFSVAAALMKEGETLFGCVYQPVTGDLYLARKGSGITRNGRPAKVNRKTDLSKITIAYVSGYDKIKDLRLALTKRLYHHEAERILDNWCPTLDYCLLATGNIECVITQDDDIHESVIGKIFIREAGGVLAGLDGKSPVDETENKFIAANNRKVLESVLSIITK